MAKEINKRVNIWLNQQGIDNNLKSIRAAITKTANELNKLPIGSEEWLRKSEKLSKLKSIYTDIQKEIGATSRELDAMKKRTMEQVVTIGSLSVVAKAASSAFRRFVSATQEYVDAYAALDDAMTNVSKYTGLTREEVKQLNEEFRKMDTRTPTEKLNALAADAGRLGITSKEAIKDFVEAADIINVALGEDLGEDAVKNIGKMAQMFGETETMGLRGAMIATASAINTLAQSSSASEPYIMDFSARLAGVANTAGLTQAQIMGIASALDQNMEQVEKSATAVQKVMMDMMANTEKYANLVGMSADELRKLIDSDMNTAFITVLDNLKQISENNGPSALAEAFVDLKLKGAGIQETLMTLANNTDQLREAQQLATQAYADCNSVINEAAAVNGNAAAQLEKAKKAVQDAKAALGEELLPVITQLTQTSAGTLRVAASVVKFWTQHRALLISLAAAYGALKVAQKAVIISQETSLALTLKNTAAGKAYRTVVFLLATAKAKLAGSTAAAAVAQKSLSAAFSATPWGAIITAVAAIATGLGMLIKNQNEARKSAEKFNVECAKEQAEAERLFEKLKNAEKGTKDYQDALDVLKNKYPEIIQKHLDEEGALRDVEQAYKDVIKQIQAKVAAQIKEEELTEATEEGIKKQVKALRGFTDAQKNTIRQMAEQGKSAEQIGSSLGISYFFTDFQGKQVKDDRFQALKDYVKAYEKTKQDIVAIDKKYDPYLKQMQTSGGTAGGNEPGAGDGGGSGGGDGDQKLQTKIANFEKKLHEFRNRQQRETMDGWQKTKQSVIDSYQSMIDEAEALYGKDSKVVEDLMAERDQAIVAAGQKYLKTHSKTLEDFSQKLQNWAKEAMPKGENELADKLLGTEQKWQERSEYVQQVLSTLLAVRAELADDPNVDLSSIDAEIERTETELLINLPKMAVTDLQNTLRQQHSDISKFIAQEQEDITNSTLTETERQKKAIRERYDVEIRELEELQKEYLKKNMMDKAVEAAEDLERLKELMNQQLSNVDTKSGNKSIWQQLAEFDWSKMSDNWQQGLNLMTQGLQEFADAAINIYGSILQIQNNATEAELQKTQEAYDAKTAALKRQLDQGVISQKAYDAKLQKLNEEKEKKERKLKHEQFAREKTANIIQSVISGALSAAQTLAQWGIPWGLIPMGIALAMTAAQTAAIASQPNPYAKGGYIRGRQYAVMGEQGDEWVASNKLLRDRESASVIAALDDYQRGNRLALQGITFNAPDTKTLSQAIPNNGRTFAPSNQTTNNYYTNSENSELLKEIRQMNDFLRDPNNRRAWISRKIQLEFDEQEEEIRELARL